MTGAQHRELSRAFTKFDRLTAYGCRERERPFDVGEMEQARVDYWTAVHTVFPPHTTLGTLSSTRTL